jgi:hypothetical protein
MVVKKSKGHQKNVKPGAVPIQAFMYTYKPKKSDKSHATVPLTVKNTKENILVENITDACA